MIMIEHEGEVLLRQQPSTGLWGGLWIFPQQDLQDDVLAHPQLQNCQVKHVQPSDAFRHTFSHYHLDIHPVRVSLKAKIDQVGEASILWYNLKQPASVGLAAPVKKLLEAL